ncbi:MAG: VOC family protein [Bacteroidota bacterium]
MKKMDPVVHFEMPYEDRKRMSDFYTNAFGWHTQMLGEDMGNYTLATTSPIDEKGMHKYPGAINGGFYTKDNNAPAQYPSLVIAVDDLAESMQQIKDAGGEIIGEPVEIPGYGNYISFFDTEGNRCSIMEPLAEMKEMTKKD